jgi:hypothetical protein
MYCQQTELQLHIQPIFVDGVVRLRLMLLHNHSLLSQHEKNQSFVSISAPFLVTSMVCSN